MCSFGYRKYLRDRLARHPTLSAMRLVHEIRELGYPGGYKRVQQYVRATRPREPVEPVVRFETPAGRQGQVDVGTFTLPWGRRQALVIVLGYSRLLWLHFYSRQTMPVLMEALESAFDRFGGVPEELLFDQMRAVVLSDDRTAGGRLVALALVLAVPNWPPFTPMVVLRLQDVVSTRRVPSHDQICAVGSGQP